MLLSNVDQHAGSFTFIAQFCLDQILKTVILIGGSTNLNSTRLWSVRVNNLKSTILSSLVTDSSQNDVLGNFTEIFNWADFDD